MPSNFSPLHTSLLFSLILCLTGVSAHAASIPVTFTGVVNSVDPDLLPYFSAGNVVSGGFAYEDTTPLAVNEPDRQYHYNNVINGIDLQINGDLHNQTAFGPGSNQIMFADYNWAQNILGSNDFISLIDLNSNVLNVQSRYNTNTPQFIYGDFAISRMHIILEYTGGVFDYSQTLLPAYEHINDDLVGAHYAILFHDLAFNSNRAPVITGTLTQYNGQVITAVPLPASLWLFLAGLVGLLTRASIKQ